MSIQRPPPASRHRAALFYNPLLFLYNTKVLKVEILATLSCLTKLFYSQLTELYYYHSYGSDILRNTSFVFPDGPFCMTSDLIDRYKGSNKSYKVDEAKSDHLATYGMIVSIVPSVIVTIMLGSLMDRFGRKIGMIFPAVGAALQAIISIYIVQYNLNPNYFLIGNFINGIFGSFYSILAASFSYIADVSSPRWRSLRVGMVEAGLAFGGALGQFFVGFWFNRIDCDFIPPLYFVTSCSAFIVVYAAFCIPESRTYEERKSLQAKNSKGLKAYIESFKLYGGRLSLRATWKLYVATIAMNVLAVNIFGDVLVSTYILKAIPFKFSAFQIGIYQSVRSVSQGMANLILMGILVSLKIGDAWIILLSIVVHVLGNALIGFSTLPWQLFTSKGD